MFGDVLLWSALAIAGVMLVTWLISLPLRNASIIDPVWPLGFVVVAWVAFAAADGDRARSLLIVALVTVWGLRLSGYLFWRNAGKGEDFRYAAMRRRGSRFWLRSLLTVFALQGVLMWVVSLPAQMGQVPDGAGPVALAVAGVALWGVGVLFETVGDWQLARFKRDPANRGKVMDRGLWRYTRHPNYFGDFCVWWGIFLVAATAGGWVWVSAVGPLLMSVLLIRVSGVALLEKDIAARRPGYAEYARRTSAFFPRPPRSA
ncbi:MAG: DUF1295 domain-containing protein [Thermoleophilia bacterium]|nr:DUF1295 domain-containing protein [Thermoleophilia bacterium]